MTQCRVTFFRPRLEALEDRVTMSGPGANNPGVLPPQSNPYGASYGEWSARLWQWAFSMPADHHPLTDTADVSAGQSGKVWFLGGTFTTLTGEDGTVIGDATRNVTIPSGIALFFPIMNTEESDFEAAVDGVADTTAYTHFLADHITDLAASVDGRAITNLSAYRTTSPTFEFGPLPVNNLLSGDPYHAPAGTITESVADGYYLMLKPFSVGEHTIHFSGKSVFTEEEDGFNFTFQLDITYNLTVVPAGRYTPPAASADGAFAAGNENAAALVAALSAPGGLSTASVAVAPSSPSQAPASATSPALLVSPHSALAVTSGSGGQSARQQSHSTVALDQVFASAFDNSLHLPL